LAKWERRRANRQVRHLILLKKDRTVQSKQLNSVKPDFREHTIHKEALPKFRRTEGLQVVD